MVLLARNHRCPRGEVDLVMDDGGTCCFVEVRSRTGTAQGEPEESVGRAKARRVVAAARDWLARNGGEDRLVRFDVVAVVFPEGEGEPEVRHHPAAFDARGGPLFG
jgi:putative endonuclease